MHVTARPDFAPGQIWTYRDAEPATSRVVIGVLGWMGEPPDGTPMVMIAVDGVVFPNPETGELADYEAGETGVFTLTVRGVVEMVRQIHEAHAHNPGRGDPA
jgi:hypothetical protein